MSDQVNDEIKYPSIVFEIGGELFCASSKYISSIMQLPEYEKVPGAPPEITGIFKHRDGTVTMLDLRRAMKMNTRDNEYQEFCDMLEKRKQDHIVWVEALERTAQTGERFMLATDPHQCALGRWYYNFKSDVQEVNFHLNKIEEPHNRLHQAALEVERCAKESDASARAECMKKVLDGVRGEYMPQILKLIDETKDVFRDRVYQEMALVLRGKRRIGIVVDEVLSVEDLHPADTEEAAHVLQFTKFISSVQTSDKLNGLILELDVPQLLDAVDTSSIPGMEDEAEK